MELLSEIRWDLQVLELVFLRLKCIYINIQMDIRYQQYEKEGLSYIIYLILKIVLKNNRRDK